MGLPARLSQTRVSRVSLEHMAHMNTVPSALRVAQELCVWQRLLLTGLSTITVLLLHSSATRQLIHTLVHQVITILKLQGYMVSLTFATPTPIPENMRRGRRGLSENDFKQSENDVIF